MNNSKSVTVSFPLCSILFITFLVLKLTDAIDWSWWWITSPLWIPFFAIVGFLLVAILLHWIEDKK